MDNKLKAVYCRTFQGAFHAAIPFLPYREPIVLESTAEIADECEKRGFTCLLLVTDQGIMKAGLTQELEHAMANAGISLILYDKVKPNPTIASVEEALLLYNENNCQAIIGFGGGSSMDCAKAVGARVARPHTSVKQMQGMLKVWVKLPPIFAVPTTAGTGSEVTVAALITDEKTLHKKAIMDFPLIPEYAVLDPKVTLGLPKNMTATTGMDALTHAIEAYIGRSTTRKTRAFSEEAVRLIYENVEEAYNNGSNIAARERMLRASFLAGMAFSMSYVGYVHAVAHSLGGQYGTPHGLANAVILPYFLIHYGKSVVKPLARLARKSGMVPEDTPDMYAADALIDWIIKVNERMGIPKHIAEIKLKDVPKMAENADKEANPLYPVPKLMDRKELEDMYYIIKGENAGKDRLI